MLHPVGNLGPSVYWRRRLLLVVAVVLAAVTAVVVFHSSGSSKGGGGAAASQSTTSPPASSSLASSTTASRTVGSSGATSAPGTTSSAAAAGPVACTAGQLSIAAASDAASYPVGAKPDLAIVVTDKGPAPCVADLADPQIELRVYAGSARVWGSHDCQVEPGTSLQTLPVGEPIRRVIQWSGLSSQPGCAGVRQRVPAGTYTLNALLAGREGAKATFAFAG